MKSQPEKKLDLYCKKNQWKKAEELCQQQIIDNPNHWWLIHLGMSLLEQNKLEEARKTLDLASAGGFCPLTEWYKACVQYDQKKYQESLEILRILYQRCKRWLRSAQTNTKCWESEKRTKELFNDCKAKIGFCYVHLKKPQLAIRWWLLHLRNRKKGQASVYCTKTIRKHIKENKHFLSIEQQNCLGEIWKI